MAAFNLNGIEFEGISTDRSRLLKLADWLAEIIVERPLVLTTASADASFRSYYRARSESSTFIVMDAPPPEEDTGPFESVARTLRGAGVAAPEVYGWARETGFMLLEDFGHTTLLARLGQREDAEALGQASMDYYRGALRALARMQSMASPEGLPPYDGPFLRQEMELFRRWLVHRHLNLGWSHRDELEWRNVTSLLVSDALDQPRVFVHRDYHSRNLMIRNEQNESVTACEPGVLDFQDAMHGPVFYDVVSLLKDCYVRLDESDSVRLLDTWFSEARRAGIEIEDTARRRQQFHSMGIQRHLKAAGIFARLWHRDGKSGYLEDIPRTLSYIVEAGQKDDRFAWCGDFIQRRVMPRLMEGARC